MRTKPDVADGDIEQRVCPMKHVGRPSSGVFELSKGGSWVPVVQQLDAAGNRLKTLFTRWAARHFKPSVLPAANSRMASRSRLVFVSCCFAESIQAMYMRRYDGARLSK